MNNIKTIMTENVNGATFISIDTSTDVKLLGGKKNLLQGRVRKITTGASVMVFQNKTTNAYENMVKRRLEKEGKNPGNFELGPRAWGTRLPNMPFVEHKGEYYLEVIFLSRGKTHYEVDGVITPTNQIEGLNLNNEEGRQGGLDDKVIVRTFKVSSLTKVNVNHQEFVGPFIFN